MREGMREGCLQVSAHLGVSEVRRVGQVEDETVQQAARKHGLTVAEIEDWQERFRLGAQNGPVRPHQGRGGPEGRAHQEAQAEIRARVGSRLP